MRLEPSARKIALLACAGVASVALFVVSRGKWSDAIIDSGREWIVPDALSRGQLLYRDVVYWFGPFTPYFHAFFLRAFGSGFGALVGAGLVGAAGVVVCLHLALRRVTTAGAAWAWTVLSVPVLVFMPDAGGAILGMGFRIWHAAGFALLALTVAGGARESRVRLVVAGSLAGLAGLCRTEWGLAAFASLAFFAIRRDGPGRRAAGTLAIVSGSFVGVMAAGLGLFVWRAGPTAVFADAPVLLFNLPRETLRRAGDMGSGGWRGLLQMGYAALAGFAAFSILDLLVVVRRGQVARASLIRVSILLAAIVVCAAAGGFPPGGLLAAGPLVCGLSFFAGLATSDRELGASLMGFGAMGLAASHRRFFFVSDGPYVAPALLFSWVCAAGCATWLLARREASVRSSLGRLTTAAVGALAAVAFLMRAAEYRSDDRVPVPGTQGMLSASPAQSLAIAELARTIRRLTPSGSGLVVFPEGEVVNFLAARSNPIRHKLYLPGYVDSRNELQIVRELEEARPAAIVIWPRPLGEYGAGFFGRDYGTGIQAWIDSEYEHVALEGSKGMDQRIVLAIRRRTRP